MSINERVVPKSSNVSLLYIEDNDEIRNLLTASMREVGYTVLDSSTTAQACDFMNSNRIDIVITDLRLPNESGMDFIRCLRERDMDTPIIITSAYSEKELLLDAIHLDVSCYLIKPFKTAELFESIEKALKKLSKIALGSLSELHKGYQYNPINKCIIASNGEVIQLSKKEYLLIELLLKNKNQIVPYSTIEKVVWNNAPMSIEALRTMVRTIRKKTYPSIISNINAHGYKMDF